MLKEDGSDLKMKKALKKAQRQFIHHFHYLPKFPPRIDFDQDELALLLRCVSDNFDYSVKKYGIIPKIKSSLPEIIED